MNSKAELDELIQQLPEEKVAIAITLIKELQEKTENSETNQDPIFDLMKTVIYAMNNSLYDLSIEAGRREEKVLANRLESYRKRVSEAWEVYKK
jgi:isopropylmalate/homocitrate/citramalate synthase